ncbi:hypothetical protein ACNKHP_21395 [Shigella boydii]
MYREETNRRRSDGPHNIPHCKTGILRSLISFSLVYRYSIKKTGQEKITERGKGENQQFSEEMPFPAAKDVMANQL